ncbi:F0F1 ATP synthase subunit epsilon [Flavobacterium sp. '19STA2R22 D10 B1']|uniref:F0F1 ATP synthase subunit epsilon n=1 Tax=Flavobacterium aerium TaxID=3037261 RepID=UPI00278C1956|nr:F0F1 ATP synthase subunit epsilon [Flavobacterium sp. '19STA2R22 D10 B1']
MYLEIVSPEGALFKSTVDSVTVPGVDGEFQMLENHAPIVSLLGKGTIKIHIHTKEHQVFDTLHSTVIPHIDDDKVLTLEITSGTLELKDNKIIILVE